MSARSIYIGMYKITVVAALLLLLSTGDADAYGTLRCKGRIIDVGTSVAKVTALCGEPARRIVTQVPVRTATLNGFTRFAGFATSEQWIYDRGWGKFPAVLYFDEGVIQRIDYLPRRSGG